MIFVETEKYFKNLLILEYFCKNYAKIGVFLL